MRVLDIGCGTGAFTFVVAEQVGESGRVLGVDYSERAIREARRQADVGGYHNVSFAIDDVETMQIGHEFDAICGRFILSYLNDPTSLVEKAATRLSHQAIMFFQEWQLDSPPSMFPESQSLLTFHRIILDSLRLSGVDMNMGLKLPKLFETLTQFQVHRIDSRQYVANANDENALAFVDAMGKALSPVAVKLDVVSSEEEFEAMQNNAIQEARTLCSTVSLNPIVGVVAKSSEMKFA